MCWWRQVFLRINQNLLVITYKIFWTHKGFTKTHNHRIIDILILSVLDSVNIGGWGRHYSVEDKSLEMFFALKPPISCLIMMNVLSSGFLQTSPFFARATSLYKSLFCSCVCNVCMYMCCLHAFNFFHAFDWSMIETSHPQGSHWGGWAGRRQQIGFN